MSIDIHDGIFASAVSRKISRRSFLKWSAALGATASASGLILSSSAKRAGATAGSVAPASGGEVVKWVATHCLVCHSWCNLAVGLDSAGCIRKIEGSGGQPKNVPGQNAGSQLGSAYEPSSTWLHREDKNYTAVGAGYLPYSPNNRGRICAKGNSGMQHTYDPDRVKYPLERMGDRGSGKWRRVSWTYAINRIADVLRELGTAGRDKNGNLVGTDVDGNARTAGEITNNDLRHRFVFYVGRNEYSGWNGRFTGRYNTPNHIEHTSLCESSRHTAQIRMMDDKFPLPDLTSHSTILNYFGAGSSLGPDNDVDFQLEVGGNPCEAKIPMTSYGVRWGDMRRRGSRLVTVDVRQSNTAAFSDEWVKIIPGTDGALAAAMIYLVGVSVGWTTIQTRLGGGHLGGKHIGFFSGEAGVPAGKSLQEYVNGTGSADPVPGAKTAAWANAITGIDVDTIEYLAAQVGACTVPRTAGGNYVGLYKNPLVDGYRGPAKHTNGVYSYRLLRALQTMAGVGGSAGGSTGGGVDKTGGLQHNAWRGQVESGVGWAGSGGDAGSPVDASQNGGPYGAGTANPGGIGGQRIDNWDYENGQDKYRQATHKCDQMVVPGIRASLGMHPYRVGVGAALNRSGSFTPGGGVRRLPYNSYDPDFKVEALMIFKNGVGNTRANIKLIQELLTAKNVDGSYKLKHFWSIDMQMGDGSRFADIILPETSFLERYTFKHYETFGLKSIIHLRQPVIDTLLYEAKHNGEVFWLLARAIDAPGLTTKWGGNLYNSFNWKNVDNRLSDGTGALGANSPNEAAALEDWVTANCNAGGIPGLSAAGAHVAPATATALEKKRFMKANGMLWKSTENCNYFPRGQLGQIQVYHSGIDATTDPSTGAFTNTINTLAAGDKNFESDGSFFGYPVYVPLTQQTDANYPLHLTTYKLNVHTQSRTASVPRLVEIIGNNWAVMSTATAAAKSISNGDTVKVTSAQGSIEIEAKVTPKIMDNVVAISNSFGHEVAGESGIEGENANGHGAYLVLDTAEATFADVNRKRGAGMYPTCLTPYDRALPASAPGRGKMPNHVIRRVAGTGENTGEMATCPIGASLAWFDTKVNIIKV